MSPVMAAVLFGLAFVAGLGLGSANKTDDALRIFNLEEENALLASEVEHLNDEADRLVGHLLRAVSPDRVPTEGRAA